MTDEEDARSREACPRCAAHRLAVIDVPDVSYQPYDPANAIQGIRTDFRLEGTPGIGCLGCGAEWEDLATLRAEQASAPVDLED
jgi:hypothetical protein